MIRNISIGIDLGTHTTKVVVGEFLKDKLNNQQNPKILGYGECQTFGLRHGYVTNTADAVASVKKAVAEAEKTSGIKIRRAFVAVGGSTLRGDIGNGTAIISKADGEVTSLDIEKAIEDAENNLNLGNRKVIQVSPIAFKLDGKEVLGRPVGMRGTKLEVKAIFVNCSIQHLEDLLEAVALAGVEAIDVIPSPLAGSKITLSEKQKIVGSLLVDIGAETVTSSVFENGSLIALHTFALGGADITNDIALGLKIPLEKAENFKLGNVDEDYSKKKLDEIIEARLSDIFELIENHLKKIKRSELLPAGALLIGGGSNISNLVEFSKEALKLPSAIGNTEIFGNMKTKLRDPSWYVALGLLMGSENNEYDEGSVSNLFKNLKNTIKSSIKQLMP